MKSRQQAKIEKAVREKELYEMGEATFAPKTNVGPSFDRNPYSVVERLYELHEQKKIK